MHGVAASEPDLVTPASVPRLTALLHAIGLDAAYHRAAGDELFTTDDAGEEVAVLDLVGGYGSLLLGHHHPALTAELSRFLMLGRPVHAQGSLRPLSERFAATLDRRAGGGHHVVLASTGAEAVEAALKHAMLITGGRSFITLEGAFHGKTLGTLPLAGHPAHRDPFVGGAVAGAVLRVRVNDLDHLDAVFAAAEDPAGFLFEPIQGEGGVRQLQPAFAQRAAALCHQRRIALIADECQCGMGRTGSFLACEQLGVHPDHVILSKALGGGLVKIAALLIRRDRYDASIDLKQTSTFAGDELSSAVALKTLELTDDALLDRVQQRGARWLEGLGELARNYPDIIGDVRGQGLMLAVELRPLLRSSSFLLRTFSATDDLALLAAGYLLRVHRVRVAPTLSCPRTLRIQSSAFISDEQIERGIAALRQLCERLRQADLLALTEHLSRQPMSPAPQTTGLRDGFTVCTYRPGLVTPTADNSIRRVAWLCHLIDDTDLISLEPAFERCGGAERARLLHRLAPLANPVVMSEVDVRSVTGQTVRLYPILLPVTSAWMKRCLDTGAIEAAAALVQKGVALAEHLGCTMAALGQYTSIVTGGGRRCRDGSIGLSTGNTYSLALALEALQGAQRQRGIDPSQVTCAIVGAAGNIGQTAARLLAMHYRETLLLGSPRGRSRERLTNIASHLPRTRAIDDPSLLLSAGVVLAATSAVDRPLSKQYFCHNAIVCDLSVPSAGAPDLEISRPDVTFIRGGIVRMPFEEDLSIVGFPLEIGRTYGCMAEALILGLEGISDRSFTGLIRAERVAMLADMAMRHGFVLDQYKRHCVLGSQTRGTRGVNAVS